jgi:cytochrome c-type biogenesis protein CcmH
MMRWLALWLLLAAPAFAAFSEDVRLADPAQERRAIDLSRELRCLVCQNQSIEDSNADLARDLRRIVRERVQAGDSDKQIFAYMTARYGDWVLLKPPFKLRTAALWAAPLVLLAAAGLGVWLFYRRGGNRPSQPVAPLSPSERARLDALLAKDGEAR